MPTSDFYFSPLYGQLCELIEQGRLEVDRYESEHGVVTDQYLIRPLPYEGRAEGLSDLITPYGYGGPRVERLDGSLSLLLEGYQRHKTALARQKGYVTHFIRFHPLEGNGPLFAPYCNAALDRYTVATDLRADDPVAAEFSKSTRKTLRRTWGDDVTFTVERGGALLPEFRHVYEETMDRDGAKDFYYFPEAYWTFLSDRLADRIVCGLIRIDGQTAAAGLYFLGGAWMHAHLSGTRRAFLSRSPAVILKAVMARWGHEQGFELIHYGGGLTPAPEDSLFAFKRQFTREGVYPFYVGRQVLLPEVYAELCAGREEMGFFPLYRGGGR